MGTILMTMIDFMATIAVMMLVSMTMNHDDGGFDSHDDIYPMEKQNMIKKTEYCVLDAHKKYFTLLHSHLLSRLQSGIDHPCKNILL